MNYLSFIENKIVREKETLIHTLSQWRFKEEKIVLQSAALFDVVPRKKYRIAYGKYSKILLSVSEL